MMIPNYNVKICQTFQSKSVSFEVIYTLLLKDLGSLTLIIYFILLNWSKNVYTKDLCCWTNPTKKKI